MDLNARWVRSIVGIALILAVMVTFLVVTPSSARAAADVGTTATVPARSVIDLQMFSPNSGVALAQVPPPTVDRHRYRYDIVRTVNGGLNWHITGSLPTVLTPSSLSVSLSFLLKMAFKSQSVGYVSLDGSSHTEFTDDGGARWSQLKVPDPISGITLDLRSLWITTIACKNNNDNPSLCPSDLVVYPLGHDAPQVIRRVPTRGPVLTSVIHSKSFEATLLSRRGDQGLFSEGGEGLHSTLLETLDAGRSWSVVTDPCTLTSIAALVERTTNTWVLYCSLDGGMHQGYNELWSTVDAGQHWTLVGEGSEQGSIPTVGNIGDGMTDDLAVSADGRDLWMLGSVEGIVVSTDGGTDWQLFGLQTGGYPGTIVTAGATEAWLALPGMGLYRTVNGMTWSRLS